MSVNATGLGELLGMPELSVQTAIRPGIPTSAPDFLSIMALKAAPPAKGLAVGLPSTGDGNPTTEDAPAAATSAANVIETAESDMDMAFDLQLPAMPTQPSPVPDPKTPGARFAAVAARHLAPADPETPVPAIVAGEQGDASGDAEVEAATPDAVDREENVQAGVIAPAVPQVTTLSVPIAPPAIPAAATPVSGEPQAAPVATAGQTPSTPVSEAPDRALADAEDAPAAPAPKASVGEAVVDAETDAATPMPAAGATIAAPAMQRPVMPTRALARGSEFRAAVAAAEEAVPAARAFLNDRADTDPANIPAPLREALPASQTAQAVLAAVHDPLSARPQGADAAQGQTVPNEALLDDLLIGNAVEDQWVDQLAADVQTLVSGDRREAQLHLKPRELGDLFIRVETNGNQAKVHFTVETAAAQGFIADAAPRLQSMMENRGVRLEEASVDVGSGRQDRGEQSRETAFEQPFSTRPRGAASQAETVRAIVRQTAIERFA